MTIITDTKTLSAVCKELAKQPYLTIDTEFLRDRTYYPKLCLVQLAGPETDAVAVDPLANGIDLAPLFALLEDESVVKVFHAARQDLEIFYHLTGKVPKPIFDTQVAAMVLGYGEQIGYNNIVGDVCGKHLDKGAQFTDWSRRPLSDKQLSYALDDVIFLREVYTNLVARLDKRGRKKWVYEEMQILKDPETYENRPEEAWRRIKIKSNKPKVLAILKEVAAWREREAQRRDIPRPRVIRDETIADLAIHPPKDRNGLKKIRNIPGDIAGGKYGDEVLKAVKKGSNTPKDQMPEPIERRRMPQELTPVMEMLKMLLRIKASEHEVAAKLIAANDDIEELALGQNKDIPVLKGWRYEVFGEDAQRMIKGEIALTLKNRQITRLDLGSD